MVVVRLAGVRLVVALLAVDGGGPGGGPGGSPGGGPGGGPGGSWELATSVEAAVSNLCLRRCSSHRLV